MLKKLSLLLILSLLAIYFSAAERTLYYALDSDGNLILSKYSIPRNKWGDPDLSDPNTCILDIPSSVEGRKVVGVAKDAFKGDNTLKTVKIPASVTYIGTNAFTNLSCIESFSVASDNPRYKIENNLLIDKTAGKIVSVVKAEEEMVIPEGITEIPENFLSFTSNKVKKLTLPESVEKIGDRAFSKQYDLASINIPKKIQYIGDEAFLKCQSLSIEVKLPDTLTYLGASSFKGTKITSLVLPSHFTDVPYEAFCDCGELSSVKFPKQIKSIGERAFVACTKLENLKIPDTVEFIGKEALYGIYFKNLVIPKAMTHISEGAFTYCKLEKITFHSKIKSIGDEAFFRAKIPSVTIPKQIESVGDQAFYESDIRLLTIEKGVKSIGSGAFYSNQLVELIIPDTVTNIESGAFAECRLEKVVLPKKITRIEAGAFRENNLKTVEIPDTVTYIGDKAFQANSLETLNLPSKLEYIGDYAFMTDQYHGYSNLYEVRIPSSVTHIGIYPFCKKTTVYAPKNSYAETWCKDPFNYQNFYGYMIK